jgi:malignant T-cell-amplified sequence
MEGGIPVDTIVAVNAEGKENAMAVGLMKMSSDDIRSLNKGIGVETLTYLGDPLWHLKL